MWYANPHVPLNDVVEQEEGQKKTKDEKEDDSRFTRGSTAAVFALCHPLLGRCSLADDCAAGAGAGADVVVTSRCCSQG